eukprot:CAMPEP_0182933360 /NCGR_PEP_ID=MMETSP0105_2-20130417/33687_1 /TAXON_ID=81532 ORGANISM="Acanthoeca-like sp., Strain 10tr" /NCGR_SAMPLE_ID=MMETSP0105_2 /ASSEMBLY_ACC=CAM_ASM_000205 /LENGTH=71 /DNA_ID=CAMNT_0025072079 /DNA_START=198 /DNA_END=409 /DNA_ORIENTATION=-
MDDGQMNESNGLGAKVSQSPSATEVIAAGCGALWLVGSSIYFLFGAGAKTEDGDGGLTFATTIFVIFLPVA